MEAATKTAPLAPAPKDPGRRWTRFILPGYSALVILYTLVPIGVMILYGFNQAPSGRLTFAWNGFTFDWYRQLFDIPDLTSALLLMATLLVGMFLYARAFGTRTIRGYM